MGTLVFSAFAIAILFPSHWMFGTHEAAQQSSVSGVVITTKGQPIRKVSVSLVAGEKPLSTLTDSEGRFHLEDVPYGRYNVIAERDGSALIVRDVQVGASRSKLLVVDKPESSVQLHVLEEAIIQGRVTDGDGDPVRDAEIEAVMVVKYNGKSQSVPVTQAKTDDRGEYRLFNLSQGSYYIRVSSSPLMSDALALGSDSSGVPPRFDPTFFPSARSSNAAEKVSLCAGEERRADITVLPASPLAVSGTVDVPAKDRLRTYVMLTAPESGSLRAARIDSDGKFKIPYVSPGDYTIAAVVSGAVQEGISNLPTAGTAITVSDGNVDGIILKPRSGISIRGRVRPTVANANPDFTGLQVALTPTDSQESMRGGLASVKSNGSFIIPHVPPGTYRIVIYADRQTNNRFASYYMKSAALNGADVLTNGVRVSSENSGILDIVIDSHGLTVDGLVSDSSGNPVPNAEVVLRPRGRFKDRSDMEQHGTSDIRGMYKLEGVAPGEYEIVAFTIADNLRAAMLILADQEHPQIKKISITNNATIPVELVEIDDLAMADNCEQ